MPFRGGVLRCRRRTGPHPGPGRLDGHAPQSVHLASAVACAGQAAAPRPGLRACSWVWRPRLSAELGVYWGRHPGQRMGQPDQLGHPADLPKPLPECPAGHPAPVLGVQLQQAAGAGPEQQPADGCAARVFRTSAACCLACLPNAACEACPDTAGSALAPAGCPPAAEAASHAGTLPETWSAGLGAGLKQLLLGGNTVRVPPEPLLLTAARL